MGCIFLVNKDQEKREKLKAAYAVETTVSKVEAQLKFGWEDLAAASRKSGRRAAEADISAAARRAYDEGRALLDLRAVYEIYGKEEIAEGCQSLSLRCGDRTSSRVARRCGFSGI